MPAAKRAVVRQVLGAIGRVAVSGATVQLADVAQAQIIPTLGVAS